MKKLLLSLMGLSLITSSVFAKAIDSETGEEMDQKKLCQQMKESLPGVFSTTEKYYSLIEGKIVKCEDIETMDMKRVGLDPFFGKIIHLTYSGEKCNINVDKVIQEAIEAKANDLDSFNKFEEEKGYKKQFESCLI